MSIRLPFLRVRKKHHFVVDTVRLVRVGIITVTSSYCANVSEFSLIVQDLRFLIFFFKYLGAATLC